MTVRTADSVSDALVHKGMTPDNEHHVMFTKTVDGVTHLITRISHGARELDDHLLSLMGKQCALYLKEFVRLVDCPLSEEEWDNLVRARCADGHNPFIHNR
jgi:hypothetical protein